MLRARGSVKWSAPGPGGFGAAVAEMDFGAAPAILDALAGLSADANFGYLPPFLAEELSAACAEFAKRRYGWDVDPALIHHVPDVIKALELAITRFSRPGFPVILPTPAYMPFLSVPGYLGPGRVAYAPRHLRVEGMEPARAQVRRGDPHQRARPAALGRAGLLRRARREQSRCRCQHRRLPARRSVAGRDRRLPRREPPPP